MLYLYYQITQNDTIMKANDTVFRKSGDYANRKGVVIQVIEGRAQVQWTHHGSDGSEMKTPVKTWVRLEDLSYNPQAPSVPQTPKPKAATPDKAAKQAAKIAKMEAALESTIAARLAACLQNPTWAGIAPDQIAAKIRAEELFYIEQEKAGL